MPRLFSIIVASIALQSCFPSGGQTPSPDAVPQFKDISASAGLSVAHISTPEKKYMIESMSGGVGFIDCDNDGKLDIITVRGSAWIDSRPVETL